MKRKRDRPAQFLACFAGWCKHFRAPSFELYDDAARILHCRAARPELNPSRKDRCLIRVTGEWSEWLAANSQGPYRCLQPWGQSIKRHNPLELLHPSAMEGWRGERPFAAIQIIHHRPFQLPGETFPCLPDFREINFDLGNPGQGALPAALHFFGEYVPHKLSAWCGHPMHTNPYRVARWLRKAGIPVERV